MIKYYADIVFLGGEFRTQDEKRPIAEAVAVSGNTIVAVGGNDDIKRLKGPKTRVVEMEGRLGLPGFWDSHFHYYDWAMARTQLALSDVGDFDECLARVESAANRTKPGDWIVGQGWNETDWPGARMPLKEDLDRVSPDNPVILWRCDLHLSVANSKALQLAGIDENTANPPEGVIEHRQNGQPNGVLREFASNLVKDVVPPPTEADRYRAMKGAMPQMHAMGITSVNDVRLPGGTEGAEVFRIWQKLRRNGDLALRCWVSIPGERIDEAVSVGLTSGFGDDSLRVGYLKFYADGGMGARTAWMLEPFLDDGSGMPLTSVQDLRRAMEKAENAGLAIMVHAIGDRANREIVTLLEERIAARKPGAHLPLLEHRIEHLQMIRPEDIRRLAALNVAACMQPPNLPIDINMIDRCLGARGRFAYSFRSALDAGVPVIFSSDCPVCNPAPLAGIHAAVTRSREDGTPEGGWHPSEKVTVEEAVRAYTISPARVYRMENRLGSVSPGKLADMIVLDRNIFAEAPAQIAKTSVDMTVFDGKIVFEE